MAGDSERVFLKTKKISQLRFILQLLNFDTLNVDCLPITGQEYGYTLGIYVHRRVIYYGEQPATKYEDFTNEDITELTNEEIAALIVSSALEI